MALQTLTTLADPAFRSDLRQIMRNKRKGSKDWSHQELCLSHKFGPILNKHYPSIPRHIVNFCGCDDTKETIRTEYDSIFRISLFDALSSFDSLRNPRPKNALLGLNLFPNSNLSLSLRNYKPFVLSAVVLFHK